MPPLEMSGVRMSGQLNESDTPGVNSSRLRKNSKKSGLGGAGIFACVHLVRPYRAQPIEFASGAQPQMAVSRKIC